MASYDSNQSGYLRYPQQSQPQPQPPYPTTPQPPMQAQTYFPPIPEQQPIDSTSPTTPFYSSSPQAGHARTYSTSSTTSPQSQPGRRRTSSTSSYNSQHPSQQHQQPFPTRQSNPEQYQYPYQPHASYPAPVPYAQQSPIDTRRSSNHSDYAQNSHAYADGEDQYEQDYGRLDEETEREYRKRYARERAIERRPTLGDSLMSVVGRVGRAFGGSERR